MKRAYLDTPHGQIHIRVAGSRGPQLVLLHETPLSGAAFDPAITPLAQNMRVLAPDTPGYGSSDPPSQALSIPEYATRLALAVDTLTGEEPYALYGVHTGAAIAVAWAEQCPHVTHVILSGLPAYEPEVRADRLENWAPPMTASANGSHLTRAWEHYNRIWKEPPVAHQNRAVLDMLSVLDRYHWAYRALFEYDPLPALAGLKQPVLFLTAERDSLAELDTVVARTHQIPQILLRGLSGQIPVRAPRVLARTVFEFINSAT